MRKLSVILIIAILTTMLVVTGPVNAEVSEDIVLSYNFEGYNKPFLNNSMDGAGPDEKWTVYNGKNNFGSYTDGDNTAMKLGVGGGPALKLSRAVSTGNIRVSFDFKGSDGKLEKMLVRFMSDTDSSGTYTGDDYQAHMFWFNSNKDEKAYYFEKLNTWTTVAYSGSCQMNQWHKAEIEITNFADGKATINYYLDKNKVNAKPISADMQAVDVLNFMIEPNDGNWTGSDSRFFLIDNLKVVCSENTIGTKASITNRLTASDDFAAGGNTLNVRMENVSSETAAALNADKVIIKNSAGESITGYTIENVSASGFDVKFAGSVAADTYSLILSDDVKDTKGYFAMPTYVEFTVYDGTPFAYTYDFEDYDKPFSQGNMDGTGPDEKWTMYNGQKNFGSYTDGGNTAMKLGLNGGPALKLSRAVSTGNIRVSFDFKGSDGKLEKMLVRFMSDTDASGTYAGTDYQAHMFWFNSNKDEKAYYFEKPNTWTTVAYSGSCPMNQWHKAEFEITNLADGKATINYYLDKNKVNTEPISADMQEVEVLNFMVEANDGNWTGSDNRYFLIDNLKVEYSKAPVVINANPKKLISNGNRLPVETVGITDTTKLTKENVIIETASGDRISGYEVGDVTADSFTVAMPDTVSDGTYRMLLGDAITAGTAKFTMPIYQYFKIASPKIYGSCDFENYNSLYETAVGIVPDENWTTMSGRSNFGALGAENNAMKIGVGGEPALVFGEEVTDGNLTIDFDVKFENTVTRLLTSLYDESNNETHVWWFNNDASQKFAHFSPTETWPQLGGWKTIDVEIENFNIKDWHKVRVEFLDINDGNAEVKYYIDGKLANTEAVYVSQLRGLQKIGFRCQSAGLETDSSFAYIDNLRVQYMPERGAEIAEFDIAGKTLSLVSNEQSKYMVVYAAYAGNVLTSAAIQTDVECNAGTNKITMPDGLVADGADSIKVMLWKDANNMQPVCINLWMNK